MSYLKLPWKKNFRTLPEWLRATATTIPTDTLFVECLKKISAPDVEAGTYAHLGIEVQSGQLTFRSNILPDEAVGPCSFQNRHGKEIVLKNLPKVTKSFDLGLRPIFGDWKKGSFVLTQDRMVYPRKFLAPKELEIKVSLLKQQPDGVCVFHFRVPEVLDKRSAGFTEDFLYNANLLQENVGACNVFSTDATRDEYLKTIHVDWEILPPGQSTLERMLATGHGRFEGLSRTLIDRFNLLEQLKPVAYIRGAGEFQRYFGAQFSDKLFIFENLSYGNAVYVMAEDWKNLSQRSRIDLLSNNVDGFERILHTTGWEQRLIRLIAEKM